jgi:hypothetical protein
MATNTILAGAKAPDYVRCELTPGDSGIDFTIVTSATITATGRKTGQAKTWDTVIESVRSASMIAVRHLFVVDDVPWPETYSIVVSLFGPPGYLGRVQTKQDLEVVNP